MRLQRQVSPFPEATAKRLTHISDEVVAMGNFVAWAESAAERGMIVVHT